MAKDQVIFGVVDRVEDLLRRQADINCVQCRADHRHGKEAFQIAVAVPVHYRNGIAMLYTQGSQSICKPVKSLSELAIGVAVGFPGEYFLVA